MAEISDLLKYLNYQQLVTHGTATRHPCRAQPGEIGCSKSLFVVFSG
jgi:hypothetical protein